MTVPVEIPNASGDKIYFGREELTVVVLEPLRALALGSQAHDTERDWQFGLYPIDEQRTRLISRGTGRTPPNTPLWWLGMRIMEPAGFIMTRRMLLGVKERAEALRPRQWRQKHRAEPLAHSA